MTKLTTEVVDGRVADAIEIKAPPIRVEVRCENLKDSLWNFCSHLEELGANFEVYAEIEGAWKPVQMTRMTVGEKEFTRQ